MITRYYRHAETCPIGQFYRIARVWMVGPYRGAGLLDAIWIDRLLGI